MHICPVCGYKNLLYPVEENPICPSCYTEFGYDDEMETIGALRQQWIDAGMPWRGASVQPPPPDWNPVVQVQKLLGFEEVSEAQTSVGIPTFALEFEPINYGDIQTLGRTFVYGLDAEKYGLGTL